MLNSFMVAESTNLMGARIFSMQSAKDLQNGTIVGKGALVTGETEIYTAADDFSKGMYLVLNPAWSYNNNSLTDQNEENYVNKANGIFRVYRLEKDMKFKIYNIEEEFDVGDIITYDSATGKYKKDADGGLKVVAVEETGFPFCVGGLGATIAGDTDNHYGYAIGNKSKKYTIEVIE